MPEETILVQTPPDHALKMELTRRDSLYLLTGISLVPVEPKPDPEPDRPVWTGLDRPTSQTISRGGTVDGKADALFLTGGGNTLYDHRGHVREVRLKPDGEWVGSRAMVRCDGTEYDIRDWHDAVANHNGATVLGGAFNCPDMRWDWPAWGRCYQSKDPSGKAAVTGVMQTRECAFKDVLIEGLRSHGAFDGIQFGSGTRGRCPGIRIFNCCFTMNRDDAIEADPGLDDLVVEQCYAETFVFFSCRSGTTAELSSIENYLLNNVVMFPAVNYADKMTSGNALKLDKRSVRVNLIGNTFASDATPNHSHLAGGLFADVIKHKKLGESRDNTFCWLGSGKCPHELPSKGFTLLAGDEARQHWDACVKGWWPGFPGRRLPSDPSA